MDQFLLIQDNQDDASKMLSLLKRSFDEEVQVIHANSLESAIARIRETDFDLIIVDIDMPDGDGIRVVNTVMEIEKKCPVITISGEENEELAIDLLNNGIQDFLLKWDFSKKQLYKSIIYSVNRKKWEESLRISEEKLKTIFESAPLGFFLIDMHGTIIDGNKATEKILGYYKNELKGKSYLNMGLIPNEEREKAIQILVRNSIGMSTGPEMFIFRKKSGEKVKVEMFTNSIQVNNEIYSLGVVRELYDRNAS